jgi:SAM-dependent methyltransferase
MGRQEPPDFSSVASAYAMHRPRYPAGLFAWLASEVDRHELAWDTATGNGQAALGLAEHFDRVIATDVSAEQVKHGLPHPRVEYRVATSERSGLPEDSADVIATAAAIHWFDLPRFYDEVRRVARPGAVAAAWTYHIGYVAPPFDELFHWFYFEVVGPYFAAGARLVDDRYAAIHLPGEEIEAPPFETRALWTHAQMLDFVRTWSGVHAYREASGADPVELLAPRALEIWGDPDRAMEVRWPIYVRAARVSARG